MNARVLLVCAKNIVYPYSFVCTKSFVHNKTTGCVLE